MNKFYIQNVFFLLSIFVYVNNQILASEPDSSEDTAPTLPYQHPTPEEIYEKSKHLLCTNPEETKEAEILMNDALVYLIYHVKNGDNYKLCQTNFNFPSTSHKKKYEDTYVIRINLKIMYPDLFDNAINKLWNPDSPNSLNTGDVQIARVYNPNLLMIQQRYEKKSGFRQKYFYALTKRAKISEDTAIIVTTSANINDHNPSNKKYENTIIKSANLFRTEVDSEDDIRDGKLEKVFVNISGFLIEKKIDHLDITYIESINGHSTI
ncbi:fam-a protein [Plasmodium vinckei petteri]|uniref:Fam-a protein n=1 Tax=Plasmodium vinckei petteri TaxID=138298 RepID=A0A6V7TI91_PLAVN|nr:fam-a protein [Plasmodium vinckei petteri]